ncbi:hypothetical protein [Streptomyces sp. NPDC056491]|uniref:hypothetical protein n=1 Tax=Streptomyces sp. NPDC056491 TaxID=3345837 RepID=UPI003675EFCC
MRAYFAAGMYALVAGVILGVSGPLLLSADGAVGHAAHLVLSAGWSWAALAFCVGIISSSKRQSAVLGVLSLVAASLAYYLVKAGQGEFMAADLTDTTGQITHFDWAGLMTKVVVWWVFAALLGPLMGVAGHLARNGPYRLPCRLVIPFVAVVETTMRLKNEAPMLNDALVEATWSATRLVAVAVALGLVCLKVTEQRRRA